MDDKIVIIEGPTPTFEHADSDWAESLCESPNSYYIMQTQLRTMNGYGLIERCHRTWAAGDTMYLHFRSRLGLEQRVPILAAQTYECEYGQNIILWLRMNEEELKYGYVAEDDDDDE